MTDREEERMGSLKADDVEALTTAGLEEVVEEEEDDSVAPVRYAITSFGVDFDVEGLRRRINRGEIVIPPFQRSYVWTLPQASRFIESLLLGLPVPEIFLSRDFDSDKYVVIDGQQRLKSIQFYYDGVFNPTGGSTKTTFKLTGVQEEFEGLTYDQLARNAQFRLDNSVIHATVVKQDAPSNENTSVYHIFDRINSSGTRLAPQEMRSAIYHGKLIDKLAAINSYPVWRSIFGKVSPRQRDQEFILRFLAFFFDEDSYTPPMAEFLNKFAGKRRNPDESFLDEAADIFIRTMEAFSQGAGTEGVPPRPGPERGRLRLHVRGAGSQDRLFRMRSGP